MQKNDSGVEIINMVNILADNLSGNFFINMYSVILLAVIIFHGKKLIRMDFIQDRLFVMILYCTILQLFLDIMSRFDGRPDTIFPFINTLGNFSVFLLNPVIPSLWIAYVHYQVFHDESRTKKLLLIMLSISSVYVVLLVLSQAYGWFYYIDQDNIYHRGSLYWIPVVFIMGLVSVSTAIVIKNRKRLDRKNFQTLIFFVIPPVIGTILQITSYGISFVLNGVVLSILVLFLNIQNRNIYTDYLTGVNNRMRLDAYLKEKVSACDKNFSAVLVDLDNFKKINDNFGHDTGDDAIETAAKLLKSSLRADDFIARFGGDEFCLVLDISNKSDLKKAVNRINHIAERYNKTSDNPFKIEFSMGYAVYDRYSNLSVEKFLKKLDIMMYANKQSSKKKV